MDLLSLYFKVLLLKKNYNAHALIFQVLVLSISRGIFIFFYFISVISSPCDRMEILLNDILAPN